MLVLLNYLKALEDSMRLEERVLRFLTVKIDDNVDLETAEEAAKSRQTQSLADKKDAGSSKCFYRLQNPQKLRRHVTERGKIVPRRITNVSAKAQRRITLNIKRARQINSSSFPIIRLIGGSHESNTSTRCT